MDHGDHRKRGHEMGEMVIFENGEATIMGGELEQSEQIVIYCDLCNEPLAIAPVAADEVFLQCLRCHAVNGK